MILASLELVLAADTMRFFDSDLANEAKLHAELLDDMPKSPADLPPGPAAQGLTELPDPKVKITHPSIGEKALSGTARLEVAGFTIVAETLHFRRGAVYVTVFSQYLGQGYVSVEEVGSLIDRRLSEP